MKPSNTQKTDRTSFRDFSLMVAESAGDVEHLPVIEKEIVHYEILRSLSRRGWLKGLAFQGGTCLRLCYGSRRYSEDLDFAAGAAFDRIDFDKVASDLKADLLTAFDVEVEVRPPKKITQGERVSVGACRIVVDTAPARRDLPSQKIKLEFASVPFHTSEVRRVRANYDLLPDSYAGTFVPCQSIEEIMADKVVSFANSPDRPRYRDLYDLHWISGRPGVDLGRVAVLSLDKHADYGCAGTFEEFLRRGRALAASAVESDAFSQQLRRFLPSGAFRALGDERLLASAIGASAREAYEAVAAESGIDLERPDLVAAEARLSAAMTAEPGLPLQNGPSLRSPF